jgi:hypothetical protein
MENPRPDSRPTHTAQLLRELALAIESGAVRVKCAELPYGTRQETRDGEVDIIRPSGQNRLTLTYLEGSLAVRLAEYR